MHGFITVCGDDQRRLLKYLFEDNHYDPLERPVLNDSDTLDVVVNLALQQIIDLDEKNEIILLSGWMVLSWNDYALRWKPEKFGNISTIRLPSLRVWTPDILLYNSADEKFDATMKTNLVVQSNGSILFAPPGIFKSICPVDISDFPFALNLTSEDNEGQLDAYVKSAEWDLQGFYAKRSAVKYDCCPTIYPYVLFTLQIRRRTLYYMINIIIPCIMLSFMTTFGYLLPPDSGEKLTLQITIMLSIVMFSLLISGIIPASSFAVPTIVTYFICVMIISSLSIVATVIVLLLHHRNAKNHIMPHWIRLYICHYLAWMLRMERPGHDLSLRTIRRFHRSASNNSEGLLANSSKSLLANVTETDEPLILFGLQYPKYKKFPTTTSNNIKVDNTHWISQEINLLKNELKTISHELYYVSNNIREEKDEEEVSLDWKFSAMVIDRLCLILFTALTVIFSSLILLTAPNFFK
ncbi:unnamed protein product, partial [Didymodactylos carnosus]